MTPYAIASLEAFIEEHDGDLTRSKAIQFILNDWFIGHGYEV